MSRTLRIILFVILVLLLLLIGFRCSQQAPEGGQTGLLDGAKQATDSISNAAKTGADTVGNAAGGAMDAAKAGADAVGDATKAGANAVGDAAGGAIDAAKAGADTVSDVAAGAMNAAKAGTDAVSDATAGAMDAAKASANAMNNAAGGASEDSLNTTAHSVIDDSIKAVVAWAKSTPASTETDESTVTESSDTSAATAATAVATALATTTATASTEADSLNATSHSVIADSIKAVVAWAKGGGTTPETAAAPEKAEAAPTAAPEKAETAPAPAKAATTEVSTKTMSAGSSIRLDGVNFASGSDRLVGNSKGLLDNVAKVLSEKGDVKVEIAGYTDSTGNAALNKSLSQKRAAKVKAYLASKGIPADRMTAVGHGQESPIADNTTAAGRKANRRVELHVK